MAIYNRQMKNRGQMNETRAEKLSQASGDTTDAGPHENRWGLEIAL